jgi:hypothetical protein
VPSQRRECVDREFVGSWDTRVVAEVVAVVSAFAFGHCNDLQILQGAHNNSRQRRFCTPVKQSTRHRPHNRQITFAGCALMGGCVEAEILASFSLDMPHGPKDHQASTASSWDGISRNSTRQRYPQRIYNNGPSDPRLCTLRSIPVPETDLSMVRIHSGASITATGETGTLAPPPVAKAVLSISRYACILYIACGS